MAEQFFYYKSNGQEYGPYSGSQLKSMASQGTLQPTDQIRREDSNWHPASKVQGLFDNNQSESSGVVSPQQTAKISSYFYIDAQNRKIIVDASKIKDLILSGIITAKTIIGNTKEAATRKAGDIPQLANIFVEYQSPKNQKPQEMVNVSPSVPVPQVNSQMPVPIQSNEVQPAATNDSAMMMAMMKEMLAAKSQQPQIIITNTNTNTNANTTDGTGAITYNLFMGFLVWFFFGWCMGGSCYLGRCSSLIVILAIVGVVITVGFGVILTVIIDFIIVLLAALQKPPTDCRGRRAIYT
ncbi:hypothetical protein FACS189419_00940 [Planctomycetales bacterium]|nr:hypothetical protein FACS189419_00940 [Planctomycetales bacterium]